jgi:putative transposase
MARPLRLEYAGAIYHVSCRMIGQHRGALPQLFRDDADRLRFLDRLADRVDQYKIRLYLFTLMANHFHLVFETPEANCSKFMHSVLTAYTVYYNLRHGRHGHLFDGRYKAKLVDDDEYLLALSRYVHLNPVKVGTLKQAPIEDRIRHLRGYRWSTYPSYIGRRKPFEFVEYGPMLGKMDDSRKRYRQFVESDLTRDDEEFKLVMRNSPRSIGSDAFRLWVDERYREQLRGHGAPEDVSFRHIVEPLAEDLVLEAVASGLGVEVLELSRRRRSSANRAIAARMLLNYAGLTQRQSADLLGMNTGAAVSVQLRSLPGVLSSNRKLARLVKAIEAELTSLQRNGRSDS